MSGDDLNSTSEVTTPPEASVEAAVANAVDARRQALEALTATRERINELEQEELRYVYLARGLRVPWAEIGEAIGLTVGGAHARYKTKVEALDALAQAAINQASEEPA